MSEKHTQGRLHVCSHSINVIRDGYGKWVADIRSVHHPDEEDHANARRLAACWNIAEGMATKEVEQGTPLVKVRDKINAQAQKLAAQKRELAAARALLLDIVDRGFCSDHNLIRIRAFLNGGA